MVVNLKNRGPKIQVVGKFERGIFYTWKVYYICGKVLK